MLIGELETAKEIVLNNLDHQMSEGAIFYNHELFSKPCGNNPEHVEATERNPVPVKNAIQFWSQWCDPVIELFEGDVSDCCARRYSAMRSRCP